MNMANVSFSIVFTNYPRLHAAVNNRSFVCSLNCNNSYSERLRCSHLWLIVIRLHSISNP